MSRPAQDITVIGEGLLADAIERALAGECLRRGRRDCRLVVVAGDGPDTETYPDVRETCAESKTPWLPVRAEPGRVVIGPLELPGVPGCAGCAELRRRAARRGE